MFNFPFYNYPYNYSYYKYYNKNNTNNNLNTTKPQKEPEEKKDSITDSKRISNTTFSKTFSDTDQVVFKIFDIKFYLDDLIIIGLLFFLYQQEVNDEMLYMILFLLLFS